MAEWGRESDHERHERLAASVRRVRARKTTTLEFDHAYYTERAADTSLSARERRLWGQLRDEVAKRLGLDAPESRQEELW